MATICDEELARLKAIEHHAWHLLNVDVISPGQGLDLLIPLDSIHMRELNDLLNERPLHPSEKPKCQISLSLSRSD